MTLIKQFTRWWIACLRYGLCAVAVTVGTLLVVITAPIPGTYKESPLCAWILTWISRLMVAVLNLRVEPFDRERIINHQGFIFANHQTYLEAIILFSIRPMRFLAKAEVADLPLISTVAKRIGTVLVQRDSKESREASREKLASVSASPPIVIFPEGKIVTTFELQPFRHGAFQLAIDSGYAYQPLVLLYDPIDLARWTNPSIARDLWKIVRSGHMVTARIVLLPAIQPAPNDDPAALADATWQAINAEYAPTTPKQ